MKAFRYTAVVLALCTWPLIAEAAKKPQKTPGPNPNLSADSKGTDTDRYFTAPLIDPVILPKLKLTAQQRPQVDKLSREFATKLKEFADKAKAAGNAPAPAKEDKKDKKKGKKGTKSSPMNEALTEAAKLREEYEEKLNDILTDAQKDILIAEKAKMAEALFKKNDSKTPPTKK